MTCKKNSNSVQFLNYRPFKYQRNIMYKSKMEREKDRDER